MQEPSGEVQFVLDGGALLHRIPWPHSPITYNALCSLYTQYVVKKVWECNSCIRWIQSYYFIKGYYSS